MPKRPSKRTLSLALGIILGLFAVGFALGQPRPPSPPSSTAGDLAPPSLSWVNPVEQTDRPEARVQLLYTGRRGIEDLVVTFNGEPVNSVIFPENSQIATIVIPLTLKQRMNHLVVYAIDTAQVKSDRLDLKIEWEAAENEPVAVRFLHSGNSLSTLEETISLAFEVESTSALKNVTLLRNGSVLRLPAPIREASGSGTLTALYRPEVALEEGINEFEVIATADGDATASKRLSVMREYSRLWVVPVGIDDYADSSVPKLRFAAKDAAGFGEFFQNTFTSSQVQTFTLVNEKATRDNILETLRSLSDRVRPQDSVVVYFAGHGVSARDPGSSDGLSRYLFPYDGNRDFVAASALSIQEIDRSLSRFETRNIFLIMDTCFGETAGDRGFTSRGTPSRQMTDHHLERLAQSGYSVLAACGAGGAAYEPRDYGHGIFTYHLLKGITGAADLDHDGEVNFGEISSYVLQHVRDDTRGKQTPILVQKSASRGGGGFLLDGRKLAVEAHSGG